MEFTRVLYIDGYWVKTGWRKNIEAQMGRKLTNKEWKRFRYKITNYMPNFLELVPLLNRIKFRMAEGEIA